MNAETAREWARRHGWDEAIALIVDDAPPPPAEALEMLRATGFGRAATDPQAEAS